MIPTGSGFVGILLASDEMHLTNYSGNKMAHTVYMSISNINKSICWKLTQGAWLTITKILVKESGRYKLYLIVEKNDIGTTTL